MYKNNTSWIGSFIFKGERTMETFFISTKREANSEKAKGKTFASKQKSGTVKMALSVLNADEGSDEKGLTHGARRGDCLRSRRRVGGESALNCKQNEATCR
jgi:hypothetical protein